MQSGHHGRVAAGSLAMGLGVLLLLRLTGGPLTAQSPDAVGQQAHSLLPVAAQQDGSAARQGRPPRLQFADSRGADGEPDSRGIIAENAGAAGMARYAVSGGIALLLGIVAFRWLKRSRGMPSAQRPASPNKQAEHAAPAQDAGSNGDLRSRVLKLGYSSSGQQLSYLPHRGLRLALVLTAAGMLLTAGGSLLQAGAAAPLPLVLLLVVTGIVLFLCGIGLLGHHRDITVSAERIRITDRYFGLARRTDIAVAVITGISRRRQDGAGSTLYSIYLHTRDGREIPIGENLPGRRIADYVVGQIRKVARIPGTGTQPPVREPGGDGVARS